MSETSVFQPLDEALYAISPSPCIVFDRSGEVLGVNPATADAFGWRRDDLADSGALSRLFGAQAGQVSDCLRMAFAAGRAEAEDIVVARRAGPPRPCAIKIAALPAEGRSDAAVMLLSEPLAPDEDRAALAEATLQAADARRARNLFVSAMSHELRSPLNAILGFAELLELQVASDPAEKDAPGAEVVSPEECVRMVRDSAEHLLSLINDILDFAKIEAGRIEFNETAVDLADVVAGAARIVRPRAIAADRSLDVQIADDAPRVMADEKALRQVLLNLAGNALKFTKEGGRILVTAKKAADGGAFISVADDGVGLPAELYDMVFEPFAQADTHLNRQFEGAGLGLPISRALMRRHDGDVTLSIGLGEDGLTATATLPPARVLKNRSVS